MTEVSIVIVTGLSGSGKSTALHALEDEGYFCVDNMPVLLMPKFMELHSGGASSIRRIAFGVDLRQKEFTETYEEAFSLLRALGYRPEIMFLTASEDVLLRRYSRTRRRHPVLHGSTLRESIRVEKERLAALEQEAHHRIDTSALNVHQLKELMVDYALHGGKTDRMRIQICSFGFRYGVPSEADLLMDVRFLPNPYFVPALEALDGTQERVRRFVTAPAHYAEFMDRFCALLRFLIPRYEKEGKAYLTIAVGCTGGRHRSVVVAEDLFGRLEASGPATNRTHRDMHRHD